MAELLEDSRAVPTAAQRAAWWAVSKAARRVENSAAPKAVKKAAP
jgi:hypothetical protein